MSAPTTKQSLRQELHGCNERLDKRLQKYGMSVKTFKIIKAITQLVGILGGIYAMHLGADPLASFGLIAFVWGGPEALDYVLSMQDQVKKE